MARIDDLEKGLVDQYGVAVKALLDDAGNELGDPTPVAPPAHLRRGMSTAEQIKQMVQRELSMRASEMDFETFEESEDFDVDDDRPDPHTPYEAVFDPPPPIEEINDGKQPSDEGRDKPSSGRSGKSGKVGKGEPSPKQSTSDKGGSSETVDGDSGSEAED